VAPSPFARRGNTALDKLAEDRGIRDHCPALSTGSRPERIEDVQNSALREIRPAVPRVRCLVGRCGLSSAKRGRGLLSMSEMRAYLGGSQERSDHHRPLRATPEKT